MKRVVHRPATGIFGVLAATAIVIWLGLIAPLGATVSTSALPGTTVGPKVDIAALKRQEHEIESMLPSGGNGDDDADEGAAATDADDTDADHTGDTTAGNGDTTADTSAGATSADDTKAGNTGNDHGGKGDGIAPSASPSRRGHRGGEAHARRGHN